MKLSFVILYVKNVEQSVSFYERAFGLTRRFIHESGMYSEMDTGATTLAFSQNELIKSIELEYQVSNLENKPFGNQITFEPEDVDVAFSMAIQEGALAVKPPQTMPWGWRCAFVRDLDGFLIEIARKIAE